MRQRLTAEAKAYEAKLLAHTFNSYRGEYRLALPKVYPLTLVGVPTYYPRRAELKLVFSAVRAIVPEHKRGSRVTEYILNSIMREGKATIREVFTPVYFQFTHNGIKVHVQSDDYLLHAATPNAHYVIAPLPMMLYVYDREPDFSALEALRDMAIWQKALEEAGL